MAQAKKSYHIAVVGATGAVGVELLRVLERRGFPVETVLPLCSQRSAGTKVSFRGEEIAARELSASSFKGIDLAFFSAGGNISKQYAPLARDAGAVVIDNSSVFRMDPDVPLVIPEINGEDVRQHRGLIANPNCTTAVTLMALYPLHRAFGVRRVIASSYQAVSGSGARAINELRLQVEAAAQQHPPTAEIYPHPIAFNVLPHVDSFLESGYTKEEMKMQDEGRRIMHLPDFLASVTCVRVPVYRAHSVAVSAEPRPGVAIPMSPRRAWLALVGSVGQPRDGNPAAAYALADLEAKSITFHRVPYDNHAAARKVRAAGLPEMLAYRLERTLRA